MLREGSQQRTARVVTFVSQILTSKTGRVGCTAYQRTPMGNPLCKPYIVGIYICEKISRITKKHNKLPWNGAHTYIRGAPNCPLIFFSPGRRHSVSGASPELLSLASPGVASMGVGSRTFGRGMPTSGLLGRKKSRT